MRIHLLILLAGVAAVPAMAAERADFSGDWVAVDATAAAADKPEDAAHGKGHGGGHGGGVHGMGGHGGGHGGGASTTASSAAVADATIPRLRAQALIIRQSDDVFDIQADGRRLAYRFDGKYNYGPVYGGTVSLAWAEPEMVIETHPDAGGSIEERYTLSADGKKLTLNIRLQDAANDDGREQMRSFVRRGTEAAAGIALP